MNEQYNPEERAFMKRALQLSLMGAPNVSPNPMVGAVIVAAGKIIGEGYHRFYGQAHAEVNAIDSVREEDRRLLDEATMYVTLEPCSHYGKTPPCAELIIRTGIPRVVVAVEDPFLKDKESGINKMRQAGIEVDTGLLRDEAEWINRRFFTAHTLKRPFILLKWAQSSDGYMAAKHGRIKFSSPFTEVLMHRQRALYDAIMAGTNTMIADRPRLNSRLWPCRDANKRPVKVSFESNRIHPDTSFVLKRCDESLEAFAGRLYTDYGITSLMVEGGARTLDSFISASLFDEIRIETAKINLKGGLPAPDISSLHLHQISNETFGNNEITYYSRLRLSASAT